LARIERKEGVMRRGHWMGLVVALLTLAVAPASWAAEKVIFMSSWVLGGTDAGYYAAREKGFYREAGLEVDIVRGYGSGDVIKRVSAKASDFGFADAASLVPGRSGGARAKEIAIIFAKAPHGVFFLEESGVRTPKDLEGRTLAAARGSATYATFGAFANLAGLDPSKVKFQFVEAASILPSVLTGKVDGGLFFVNDMPVYVAQSKGVKKSLGTILYRDSGFNIYSNGILAHDDDIAGKPDRVRRFLKATVQGLAYGIEHPEEAAGYFLQHNPTASKDIGLGQWKVAIDLLSTPEAKQNGIGYMLEEKMKNTRDLMVQLLDLKTEIQLADLYTNEFNPKLFPKAW
jgi:NitT/TauT family transport system substrate-binding protein